MKKTKLSILLIFVFGQIFAQTNTVELSDSTSINIDSLIDVKLKQSNEDLASLRVLIGEQDNKIKKADSLREVATEKAIKELKSSLYSIFITHTNAKKNYTQVYDSISSINKEINSEISLIEESQKEADTKINKVNSSLKENNSEINLLQTSLSEKEKMGLGVISLVILLIAIVYFVIKKASEKAKRENEKKLNDIFENQISDGKKLIEWLEELSKTNLQRSPEIKEEDIDHSFAKRIANEITTLSNTLFHMDESVKGYKHLKRSLKKLETSLKSNGYEMIDYLNKEFKETMNVSASFIPDDTLEDGVSIITRILQPQINYNGKLIQAAEVQVSQG